MIAKQTSQRNCRQPNGEGYRCQGIARGYTTAAAVAEMVKQKKTRKLTSE